MDVLELADNNKLKISVKTNAPKTTITGFDKETNTLKLDIHAPPEKGRANAEIIKFFSKLTKKNVEIVSGKTSKKKTLKLI